MAVENKKRPLFLLLAGSNGAGKSTFVKDNAFKKFLDILRKRFNISSLEPYQIINPDIISLSRLMINPEIDEKTANLWSVQEIEKSIGKYIDQKVLVVEIEDYIYLCPFIENDNEIFLKTIYPSRKLTKIYLNEGVLKNEKD